MKRYGTVRKNDCPRPGLTRFPVELLLRPLHGNAVGQAWEFKHSDVERRWWCGDQPPGKIAESGNNHHVGDSLPFFREKGESVPVGQSMTADAPEHAGFRDAGKRDLDDRP